MKNWGYGLVTVGIVYLLYAFNMDVSVTSPTEYIPGVGMVGGQEVANLDLMGRRQNHIIVASLITAIGAAMAIFGKDENEPSSGHTTVPNATLPPVDFEGERDLSNDKYRLWLAKHYDIQRNDVFDRFVLDETTFDTLDGALAEAHALEERKIDESTAAKEERMAQIEQEREDQRIRNEEAEAEWQEFKPKLIVGFLLFIAVIGGVYFVTKETPEEREARLAAEAAEYQQKIADASSQFGVNIPDDATDIAVELKDSDSSFYCDGIPTAIVLSFETDASEEEVQTLFAETLGEGSKEYPSLEDDYNWNWDTDGVKRKLSMYGYGGKNGVHLCMTGSL